MGISERVLFLFGIVLVMGGVLGYSNPTSNWQANQPTFDKLYSGDFSDYWPILNGMKDGQCNATTDFVIGIPPGGCSPSVVTSDLLAEQNVPVFCELYAIKVNPLIKVSSIKSISFKGDYPEGVRSIVYHPARAAVNSYSSLIGSPTLENIGYVVIILEQNKVEDDMEEWVAGNLTATMTYDADDAYGVGRGDYYLEPMSDEDWSQNYEVSSFWNGRGYLRVSDIVDGKARIEVLGDSESVLRTVDLEVGETSSSSYLPGFYCKAGLKVKLTGITTQEDMARLNVDGEDIWVRKGSKFLDGKCYVSKLSIRGNSDGDVTIRCTGTSGYKTLSLSGAGANFKISDKEVVKKVGENVVGGYYLAYVGNYPKGFDSGENEIVILNKGSNVAAPGAFSAAVEGLEEEGGSVNEFESRIKELLKADSDYKDSSPDFKILVKGDVEGVAKFLGAADALTEDDSSNDNFDESVKIVRDELVAEYGSEEKDIGGTWGEEALFEEIVLAGKLKKFKTKKELMDLFLEEYPTSDLASYVSNMRSRLAGVDYSESVEVFHVGDDLKSISVVDFKTKDEGEESVDFYVGGRSLKGYHEGESVSLGGDTGDLKVLDIYVDRVRVSFESKVSNPSGDAKSRVVTLLEGSYETFNGVKVSIDDINVKQVAHVELIPDVSHEKSEADFTFRIGIEQRAIKLSPEKAMDMAENLNETIKKWQEIVDKLGDAVKVFKGACFATSAVLMIKNMASGADGEAAARTKVMPKYKEKCDTEYPSMSRTECYNELSDEIDADVASMAGVLSGVNLVMESVQEDNTDSSGGLFGGEAIANQEKYLDDLKSRIDSESIDVEVDSKTISVPKSKLSSVSQVRAVLTWEAAKEVGGNVEAAAKSEMDIALRNTALSVDSEKELEGAVSDINKELGVSSSAQEVVLLTDKDTKYYRWSGKKGSDYGASEYKDKAVQLVSTVAGANYLVVLGDKSREGNMRVSRVLTKKGDEWAAVTGVSDFSDVVFIYTKNSKDCSNPWPTGKAEVSYYGSGDNKGLPAIVPFDLMGGWYAMVPNSGGTFLDDSPQGYTASADVKYFKICNIGSNGIMQSGKGDDLCQSFDVNSAGSVSNFIPCPGLSSSEVSSLYQKAREAIREASSQYGESSINIFDQMIKVGRSMSEVGGFECQDFMSPSDCKLMFNVCDPVICPPSRCDFGGAYPVDDVIQTGIIGSILLCLPNAKEGIYVPVCLAGIHAGLDSYLSILKSERDCLLTSAESGELVGICDQITSVYKCEFFWRQVSPLMDQLIPGILQYAVGGSSVHGGGEYALAEQAWQATQKSISYFKDIYAQNAFRAFNIRSTQEIGTSFCKAFIGTSAPGSADFIDDLLAPESPSQFYAQFSEQSFSEATVPATAQYKVYYHIYAGSDQGVQYKIYLKNPPATSYYANNPEIPVKSGFIAAGSTADESVDFTAPTGYKELCVVINDDEECGFRQVTTDFGLKWLSEKYTQEQVEQDDIKTEKECVSGSPSALALANTNLEAGVSEAANPEISLRGIVRVCASENPENGVGAGSIVACSNDGDNSLCGEGFKCDGIKCVAKDDSGTVQKDGDKWVDVGYCGDVDFRCWLDTSSVEDDLGIVSQVEGDSIKNLDANKGLIENTRLDLEGVAAVLSKARTDSLQVSSKGILAAAFALNITDSLDTVIGTDTSPGAGTNVDRAEALSLKAFVYRALVEMGILEVAGDAVVEASVDASDDLEDEEIVVSSGDGEGKTTCDLHCSDGGYKISSLRSTSSECVAGNGVFSVQSDGDCCCYNKVEISSGEAGVEEETSVSDEGGAVDTNSKSCSDFCGEEYDLILGLNYRDCVKLASGRGSKYSSDIEDGCCCYNSKITCEDYCSEKGLDVFYGYFSKSECLEKKSSSYYVASDGSCCCYDEGFWSSVGDIFGSKDVESIDCDVVCANGGESVVEASDCGVSVGTFGFGGCCCYN